ncbi:MAG: coniferyl aldehyde dehydrogenase [Aquabacterium sp.]
MPRKPTTPPPADTSATLTAALAQQRQAHRARPMPTLRERQADLRTLARFVREQRDAMADAISADYGQRSRHETLLMEVGPALAAIRHAAKHLPQWMKVQARGVDRLTFGMGDNRVIPQPLGVVGVIVPWNFPLNLSWIPLSCIFAAGNRAMVKFSEKSPHFSRLLVERLPSYFPAEKLQVFADPGGLGPAFSQLPFDHLLFTGSSTTGRAVMAAAAGNLCPVTLELGGRSPAIVCDDFDTATAADRIGFVKFLNAGQVCTTVDHVYVPRRQLPAFVEQLRASVPRRYPRLDTPDYTSIIDHAAYRRLRETLKDAAARGAHVEPLLQPAFDDAAHRIAPHLVLDAAADSTLLQREIFGPILPVLPYDDLDKVLARINDGPRPLALYPFSNKAARIERIIERTMSGGVTVNDALMHVGQEDLPFGGVGDSGMGHYHGVEGFMTFSKLRPVFTQARFATTALLSPPYGAVADRLLKLMQR